MRRPMVRLGGLTRLALSSLDMAFQNGSAHMDPLWANHLAARDQPSRSSSRGIGASLARRPADVLPYPEPHRTDSLATHLSCLCRDGLSSRRGWLCAVRVRAAPACDVSCELVGLNLRRLHRSRQLWRQSHCGDGMRSVGADVHRRPRGSLVPHSWHCRHGGGRLPARALVAWSVSWAGRVYGGWCDHSDAGHCGAGPRPEVPQHSGWFALYGRRRGCGTGERSDTARDRYRAAKRLAAYGCRDSGVHRFCMAHAPSRS